MDFKAAFERYQNGTASEEEKEYIEQELEKNELITQYLLETDGMELNVSASPPNGEATDGLKKMKKSIKKRNVCLIACAVAVVVCLALFVQFAAKPLLNQMFYDPQKSTYEKQTSNFGICLAAYTELHCPGKQFYRLTTKNTGIGSYDLTITRGDSLTGGLEYLPATLHRGKLSLAQEFWSYPMANAFTRGVSYSGAELQKETLPDTVAYLKTLPDYVNVKAALSFQKDLSMEELAALQMKDQNSLPILWVAVRNANYYRNAEIGTETTDSSADVTGATVQMNDSFPVQLLPQVGFEPNGTGIYFEQINNSYPNFELSPHLSDTDSKKNGALYESHFQTLLQVMADHPDFLKTLESYESNLSDYYAAVQRFIKANGIKTYGVTVLGSPSEILQFCELAGVEGIFVEELTFSRD